jgi:protein-S-isoprenylcysteine O-methyltransferase Ste14
VTSALGHWFQSVVWQSPKLQFEENDMFKLIAFVVLSVGLIYISRGSLRSPRSHGFYRFFAWEFIVALFLLNIDVWFRAPWSWYQLISWFLLSVCIVPLVFGIRSLVARGKPVKQREAEPQLLAFEKTSTLVTTGIYHYIRHPLYSSLLFLTWGIFFKAPAGLGVLLALAATLFLVATARADEAECIRFFGSLYQAYMKQTKMFVPFVL